MVQDVQFSCSVVSDSATLWTTARQTFLPSKFGFVYDTFGQLTVSRSDNFIFWGSKITADGDCSHEIKRRILLARKVMANLNSIFKSRDIYLPNKDHLVKAMVFPVVIYGCESWT